MYASLWTWLSLWEDDQRVAVQNVLTQAYPIAGNLVRTCSLLRLDAVWPTSQHTPGIPSRPYLWLCRIHVQMHVCEEPLRGQQAQDELMMWSQSPCVHAACSAPALSGQPGGNPLPSTPASPSPHGAHRTGRPPAHRLCSGARLACCTHPACRTACWQILGLFRMYDLVSLFHE